MTKPLSPRQLEYVQLLSEGLSDKQIAKRMGISPGSARLYAHRIHEKLDVHNRIEVLMHCLRDGMISLCLAIALLVQSVDIDFTRPTGRGISRTSRMARQMRRVNGRLPVDLLDDFTNGAASEYLQTYDLSGYRNDNHV